MPAQVLMKHTALPVVLCPHSLPIPLGLIGLLEVPSTWNMPLKYSVISALSGRLSSQSVICGGRMLFLVLSINANPGRVGRPADQ